MQLVEEPLVTRREIVRSLKLGAPSTDAPFATLRGKAQASAGWSIVVRAQHGRVAGRVHVYNGLNLDAARAVRLRQHDLGRRLAARAADLERTPAAEVVVRAVRHASARLAAHLDGVLHDDAWSDRLTRYLESRERADWDGLDRDALAREWVVRSQAWLDSDPHRTDEVRSAVRELATGAQAARLEELAGSPLHVDSFVGVVRHIDPDVAEVVGRNDEAWVVSRRELDREGLARLGEAVTLVREELPGGGEAWLAAPAVKLEGWSSDLRSDRDDGFPFSGPMTWLLDSGDQRWLDRALRRAPFVLACSPIRLEPAR